MKKLLAIILVLSMTFCFAACGKKDIDNTNDTGSITTAPVTQNADDSQGKDLKESNTEEFRKEFISLAEKNATKTSEALPSKWNGEPVFRLGEKTIRLPIKVQDFVNITGYNFTASGPNEDGSGDWETKMIKSNQIDSFFDFFKYEEYDENGKPKNMSVLEIGVYNPYDKETIVTDCYVVYVVFGMGGQSDLRLVIDEERITYPKATFSGSIKIGDSVSEDDLSTVFGTSVKDSEIERVKTYWFYTGEDGKIVIETMENEIDYAECFYKLPIEEQNITYEEKYPPKDLQQNFDLK